jgi:hypothetical protein
MNSFVSQRTGGGAGDIRPGWKKAQGESKLRFTTVPQCSTLVAVRCKSTYKRQTLGLLRSIRAGDGGPGPKEGFGAGNHGMRPH